VEINGFFVELAFVKSKMRGLLCAHQKRVNDKHQQAETPAEKVLNNNSKLSLQKLKGVINYAPHQNRVRYEKRNTSECDGLKRRNCKIFEN